MQTQTLFIIFAIFAQSTYSTRNNLSRQQQLNRGQIKLKPIHFQSNAERVKETEEALNQGLDNFLANNDIHVTHAEREFTLKGKNGQHKYTVVLKKEDNECKVEKTVSFAITQCEENKNLCQDMVKECLDKLAPQLLNFDSDEQPLKNKESSEESLVNQNIVVESSEEQTNVTKDQGSDPVVKNMETQTLEDSEETDKPALLGGYNPCTDHDLKRVHAGLMHLQKYAWLNFDHLYLENIALCSQQFFFRQSNYSLLLTFDTTKKCQMKLNIEYDGTVESEHVTRVNVYQNTGDEGYAIFKRNPSNSTPTAEFADCANYFGTPLYRMTLEKYNKMSDYAEKKAQVTARLDKRHN